MSSTLATPAPRPSPSAPAPLRVLAFTEYFLPGFRAGGPVRTLANLARLVEGDVELTVVTRDRDFQDVEPYPGVPQDAWTVHEGVRVRYVSPRGRTLRGLARLIREHGPDLIYLNSLWAPFSRAVLLLRWMGRIPDRPVVLAPRGELAAGALSLKTGKKMAFFSTARAAGLLRGLTWQATSEAEAGDIRQWAGPDAPVVLAQNPSIPASRGDRPRPPKAPGELRLVYLSRINPSKNLLGAVEALHGVEGTIVFDVYGTIEGEDYLERCLAAMAALPPNVTATFHGPVPPDRVDETLSRYHVFILRTLSENFGHSIAEALCAGCPALITDQTPWRGLSAENAGWDLPLADDDAVRAALRQAVEMDDAEWRRWAAGARAYAERALRPHEARDAFLAVLRRAMATRRTR